MDRFGAGNGVGGSLALRWFNTCCLTYLGKLLEKLKICGGRCTARIRACGTQNIRVRADIRNLLDSDLLDAQFVEEFRFLASKVTLSERLWWMLSTTVYWLLARVYYPACTVLHLSDSSRGLGSCCPAPSSPCSSPSFAPCPSAPCSCSSPPSSLPSPCSSSSPCSCPSLLPPSDPPSP